MSARARRSSRTTASSAVDGRVVAITGGARGIGHAIAVAFAQEGARVAIGDLDGAEAAAQQIPGNALGLPLDVARSASVEAFAEAVQERLGPVEILVNNAGIMPLSPFVDEPEQTARRVFDVNVHGPLNTMRILLPDMLARRSGHVINIASAAGRGNAPGGLSYCASKAAVVSLTETARVEHAGTGVHFTCVLPSFTDTELVAGAPGTRFVATVSPDDVAAAVVGAAISPKPEVWVPRSIGLMLGAQQLLPRPLRDALMRMIGGHRAFLDIDHDARGAYVARVERVLADGNERDRDTARQ